LRVRKRAGCDVYIQRYAADQNAGHILIDLDHADVAVLRHMRANAPLQMESLPHFDRNPQPGELALVLSRR